LGQNAVVGLNTTTVVRRHRRIYQRVQTVSQKVPHIADRRGLRDNVEAISEFHSVTHGTEKRGDQGKPLGETHGDNRYGP